MPETIIHENGMAESGETPRNPEHSHELGEHEARITNNESAVEELKDAVGAVAAKVEELGKSVEHHSEQMLNFASHESVSSALSQANEALIKVSELAERIEHKAESDVGEGVKEVLPPPEKEPEPSKPKGKWYHRLL